MEKLCNKVAIKQGTLRAWGGPDGRRWATRARGRVRHDRPERVGVMKPFILLLKIPAARAVRHQQDAARRPREGEAHAGAAALVVAAVVLFVGVLAAWRRARPNRLGRSRPWSRCWWRDRRRGYGVPQNERRAVRLQGLRPVMSLPVPTSSVLSRIALHAMSPVVRRAGDGAGFRRTRRPSGCRRSGSCMALSDFIVLAPLLPRPRPSCWRC